MVDLDHLVDVFDAGDVFVRRRQCLGAVQLLRESPVKGIGDERALPRAGDTGDGDELAERDVDGDILQVVPFGAMHRENLAVPFTARGGNLDLAGPAQELAGDRIRHASDVVHRARRNDVAAVLAGARTDVDDPVRVAHHVFVVLDDDQRIPDIAQANQGLDQPFIVALMQTNARFIEDVKHSHQARPDLRRQSNALGFAARKGVGGALESQIVESDIDQESESLADLFENLTGDGSVANGKNGALFAGLDGELPTPVERPPDRERRNLDDICVGNRDGQHFRFEASSLTGRARTRRHVALDFFPHPI